MIHQPRRLPAVCILYGLAEGPAHSREMRRLLEQVGFRITKKATEADILLAHSGGYFLIPANHDNKLIMLIGPCNGYRGNSMFLTQVKKVLVDFEHSIKQRLLMPWLYKSFWQAIYLVGKQRTNNVMYRGSRRLGKVLPKLNPKLLSVILYRDDPWSWHGDRDELLRLKEACLISHKGLHDDLWMHPEQYVAILQYLYETRVLARPNQR